MAEKNLGDLKAKFKVDVDQMEKLVKGITTIRTDFKALDTTLTSVNKKLNATLAALQRIKGLGGVAGIGGGGANPTTGAITPPAHMIIQNNTVINGTIPATPEPANTGGGGGGQAGINPYGRAASVGLQAVTSTINAMNARMDNNLSRSLSADKLGVYYQQTKGISQMQYVNQMRTPLADQRLGYGGISTLLALEAATGLKASKESAAGYASMRVSSGYSLSTEQLAQQAATLAGPAANNRMTMMLGTGMYGLGGKQRTPFEVMQQVVQRTGLLNDRVLKGAKQQGSNTRAMLLASGVPEDMVDQYIDYAQQTQTYRKTTGKKDLPEGSKASDRRLMGIEDNYASQAEETARVSEKRDENYYARNADNLAQFEKNTQAVTRALGGLEEKLSGIVGENIGTRGSIGRKGIGSAMMAAGGGIMVGTSFTGVGAAIGAGIMGLGAVLRGDPVNGDNTKGATIPLKNGQIPLADIVNSPEFSPLNASFKNRLLKMFQDNPKVGLASGARSETEQKALFLSRYVEVPNGEDGDATYNGKQYRHVSGAPVAPPGTSMHELGLAADLSGDIDWVEKNAAKYGLKAFGGEHGEPWHVQPAELPRTRAEYQAGLNSVQSSFTTSASQQIESTNLQSLLDDGAAGGAGISSKGSMLGSTNAPTPSTGATPGVSKLETVATNKAEAFVNQALKAEGDTYAYGTARDLSNPDPSAFDCSGLVVWAAKQSGYEAPGFGNTNAEGLYQFTKKTGGELTPEEAKKQKGALLFRKEAGAAAHHVAISLGDGTTMEAKGTAEGVGQFPERDTWNTAGVLPGMSAAVGDPEDLTTPKRNNKPNVKIGGNTSVTIAPNIYVTSTGNNPSDAYRMAQELARLIDKDLRQELLRTT